LKYSHEDVTIWEKTLKVNGNESLKNKYKIMFSGYDVRQLECRHQCKQGGGGREKGAPNGPSKKIFLNLSMKT
jgi:hypothetical protein